MRGSMRYRRGLLEHATADVDREIEPARDAVLEAFAELKRFEVTLQEGRGETRGGEAGASPAKRARARHVPSARERLTLCRNGGAARRMQGRQAADGKARHDLKDDAAAQS